MMTETQLLLVLIALSVLILILLAVLLVKASGAKRGTDEKKLDELTAKIDRLGGTSDYTNQSLNELSSRTEYRLTNIQKQLSDDIKYMSDTNAKNLEVIRRTVDENLTNTLEGKLARSYSDINARLEAMYKSLGEVRSLSSDVTDIKKIFSNVKLRGTWGESNLAALLEQMLAPEQYEASVKVDPLSSCLVDFAVKVPSADETTVWLPIDSKFPIEEYERLMQAPDKESETKCLKNLEKAIKLQADSIAQKYIRPPHTTDFAVMYLPTEGLYAEVLKMPAANDFLFSRRIIPCGPTNLGALLSTLRTGFKTAAIERRSGELWKLLSDFKTEFSRFNDLLDKTSKKLQEAQDSIDGAARKTRAIARKLKDVDAGALPGETDEA